MHISGFESVDGIEARDPFSSSSDGLDVWQSFSFSTGDKLTGWISVVQEFGERHLLVCSENAADPNASEPSTEVGDWVSFSATDRLMDGDVSDSFGTNCPLKESTDLRGYGWRGFLFGRGGGMSIGWIGLSALPSGSRTTCNQVDIKIMECWNGIIHLQGYYVINWSANDQNPFLKVQLKNPNPQQAIIIYWKKKIYINLREKLLSMASNLNCSFGPYMFCTKIKRTLYLTRRRGKSFIVN